MLRGLAGVVSLGLLAAGAMAQEGPKTLSPTVADPSVSMVDPTARNAAEQKALYPHPQTTVIDRGSPPVGGGCQQSDGAQAFNYTAFQIADNFNAGSTGSITALSWSAAYRAGTAAPFANGTPPTVENFQIRFFNDAGGVPGTLLGAPLTVSTQGGAVVRTNSGAVLGALTIWDYTATITGPSVTAGTCYWLEIRNTSVLVAPTNVSFWVTAAAIPGDTFSMIGFPSNCNPNNGYSLFDINTGDMTFCLNIQMNTLDGVNCPFPVVPAPQCNNSAANGQGIGIGAGGINSVSPGSVYTGTARIQCAEKFQLAPGSGGNLNSVCFWGFWLQQVAGGRLEPCPPVFDVTIWNSDAVSGAPTTAVGTRRANVDAGVTLTRGQDAAGNDIYTVNFSGNPIALMANTCYHITISHVLTTADVTKQATWVWGTVPDNAANPLLDNTFFIRNISLAGVAAAWQQVANIGANFNNFSYLLNIGPTVQPTCVLPTPANDTCATATLLPSNGTVLTGFNANGTAEALPGCAFDVVVGPTVWYRLVGTGNNVTVTTCNAATNFDTILAVYCAPSGCAGPVNCVGGNDDDGVCAAGVGATASTVTFATALGTDYFVVVYGAQVFNAAGQTTATFSTGSFGISATNGGLAVNPPSCASLARCVVDAEPFDFAETDLCGAGAGVDTNNACATPTDYPTLGQIAKGTLSTTGNTRDIDLYKLPTASLGQTVAISLRTESPAVIQVLNEATGTCGAGFTVVPGTTLIIAACVDLNTLLFEAALPATGNNYVLLTIPNFDGDPCGAAANSQNDYRLRVGLTPTGACCVAGACQTTSLFDCAAAFADSFFQDLPCLLGTGQLDICAIVAGNCCLPDNTCQLVPSINVNTSTACAGIGGTFTAAGVCNPNPCQAGGSGACCCGASCTLTSAAACVGTNRAFAGNGTVCNAVGNLTTPCCKADFNHSAPTPVVSLQDLFDFLTAWFSNDACADTTGNGVPVTLQDLFDFLTAWFAAPVGGGC